MRRRISKTDSASYCCHSMFKLSTLWKIFIISVLLGLGTALISAVTSMVSGNSTDILKNELRSSVYLGSGNVLLSVIRMLPVIIAGLPWIGDIKNDFPVYSTYVIPRTSRKKWFLSYAFVLFVYSTAIAVGYVGANTLVFAVANKQLLPLSTYIYMSLWILILYVLFSYFYILMINVLSLKLNLIVSMLVFLVIVTIPNMVVTNNKEHGIKMLLSVLSPLSNFELHIHNLPRFSEIGDASYEFFTPVFSAAYFLIVTVILLFVGVLVINRMDLTERN